MQTESYIAHLFQLNTFKMRLTSSVDMRVHLFKHKPFVQVVHLYLLYIDMYVCVCMWER